ncbi:hypothetical protein HZC00_04810 [Candidatus Kaiserbacteria bacterium]|nr:hypothetical protein [Candidatus Kaiserbacteria bacterium]
MSLLDPKSLDEKMILLLKNGGLNTQDSLIQLRKSEAVTKQGFYAALRRLKAEDCVVVQKRTVSLNTTWIQKMRNLILGMERVYTDDTGAIGILSLADKESISYSFATIQQLDAFWGHAQNIIVHATPASDAVYTYDPHYWFYIGRKDTEHALIDEVTSLGKQFLMTVGGNTALDKVIRPDFNTELRQYHIERLFEDETYYVVVMGDFIFETRLDPKATELIEEIYQRNTEITGIVAQMLAQIPKMRVRSKLKISRNRTCAKKLRSKMAKNFFVKGFK